MADEKEQPTGILTPVGVRSRNGKASDMGVWVDIIAQDEKGKRWYFPASCFSFDMVALETECSVEGCELPASHRLKDGVFC